MSEMGANVIRVLFIVAGFISIGSSLSAATMSATYEGIVLSGYDASGVFGDAGVVLDGEMFVLSFTYDTLISRKGDVWAEGGDFESSASPILSARIAIKGVSHEIVEEPAYTASVYLFTGFVAHRNAQGPGRSYPGGYQTSGSFAFAEVTPVGQLSGDLESEMSFSDFSYRRAMFRIGGFDLLTGQPWAGPSASGNLEVRSLTIEEVLPAPVPLPSSGMSLLLSLAASSVCISLVRAGRNRGT
jgi:hypothetical protein